MVHVDGASDDLQRPVVRGEGFNEWHQPTVGLERAFVLAGGGATGIAWEAGIVIGLRDGGIDVRDADTMIGTSAGSMVAAHLRVGTDEGNAFARIQEGAPLASYGRLGPSDAARYLRARSEPRQAQWSRAGRPVGPHGTHHHRGGLAPGDRPRPGRQALAAGSAVRHRGRRRDRHLRGLRQHQRRAARTRRRGQLCGAGRLPRCRGRWPSLRRRRPAHHRQRRPRRGSPSGARALALPDRLAPARPAAGAATPACKPRARTHLVVPTPRTCGRWGPTRSTEPRGRNLRDRPRARRPGSPTGSARCGPTDRPHGWSGDRRGEQPARGLAGRWPRSLTPLCPSAALRRRRLMPVAGTWSPTAERARSQAVVLASGRPAGVMSICRRGGATAPAPPQNTAIPADGPEPGPGHPCISAPARAS